MKRVILMLALAAPMVVSCGTGEEQNGRSMSDKFNGGLSLTKGGFKKKTKKAKATKAIDAGAADARSKLSCGTTFYDDSGKENAYVSSETIIRDTKQKGLAVGTAVRQKADTSYGGGQAEEASGVNWIHFDEECAGDPTDSVSSDDKLIRCNQFYCTDGTKRYPRPGAPTQPVKPVDLVSPYPGSLACSAIAKLPSCIKTGTGYTVHEYKTKPGTCDWLPAPGEIVKGSLCKGLPGAEGLWIE